MHSHPVMNTVKAAAIGMAAGVAVGCCGKMMYDKSPKFKKKANKALRTMESVMDTAHYIFK